MSAEHTRKINREYSQKRPSTKEGIAAGKSSHPALPVNREADDLRFRDASPCRYFAGRRTSTMHSLNADIGMKPCRIGPSVVHSLSPTDNTDTGVLQRLTRILTTLGPLSGHLTPARRRPLIGCRRAVERGR